MHRDHPLGRPVLGPEEHLRGFSRETIVAFRPERLLDFVHLERDTQSLGLDQPLRFRAAQAVATATGATGLHVLEREFGLSGAEILEMADLSKLQVRAYFDELAQVAPGAGFRQADGVLFDLGVSSPQLDVAERGFNYELLPEIFTDSFRLRRRFDDDERFCHDYIRE